MTSPKCSFARDAALLRTARTVCEDRIAQPSTPLHQRAVKGSGPPAELGTRDAEGRVELPEELAAGPS
jgi:hypothetical protein